MSQSSFVETTAIMDSSSPDTAIHGVLLSVFGTGVLITGESGTGKSDCALELLSRGHKLITDDVVEITRSENILAGKAPACFTGLLHVRGLGIVDVRQIFGANCIEPAIEIVLCVDLDDDDHPKNIECHEPSLEILGLEVPRFVVPVGRGRNLPLLVETAVKLHLSGGVKAEEMIMTAHD